ncbi:hypothetical protein ACGFNU_38300 [Spirillospora sp. NPDC048911]|uniref:hypothetical protein n=1 Tax=Spirillospora sp. NPDC048911 TaxID=3364527 RepID=UPI003716C3F4
MRDDEPTVSPPGPGDSPQERLKEQLARERDRQVERSRRAAKDIAETEQEVARVREEVADTYDAMAARTGDPRYRQRAEHARQVAHDARAVAAGEHKTATEPPEEDEPE